MHFIGWIFFSDWCTTLISSKHFAMQVSSPASCLSIWWSLLAGSDMASTYSGSVAHCCHWLKTHNINCSGQHMPWKQMIAGKRLSLYISVTLFYCRPSNSSSPSRCFSPTSCLKYSHYSHKGRLQEDNVCFSSPPQWCNVTSWPLNEPMRLSQLSHSSLHIHRDTLAVTPSCSLSLTWFWLIPIMKMSQK